jgi:signal transduction histidine kinase
MSEAVGSVAAKDTDDPLMLGLEDAPVPGQAAFDRLNAAPAPPEKKKQETAGGLGRVEDLQLDQRYQGKPAEEGRVRDGPENPPLAAQRVLEKRGVRKERSALPEPQAPIAEAAAEIEFPAPSEPRIRIFESEIDPFEFSLLDSGDAVLFRKVWRDGQRYIQGALIERQPFFQRVIESAFRETALSRMSDLIVAYQGDVLSAVAGASGRGYLASAEDLGGALLYQTRLSAPFSDLELIFSITRLPAGPGAGLITWVAAILAVVLCGGFYLMYRLGVVQINLIGQQRNFVSAVSHELKTPLTSIRMYAEMLREGWVPEEKKMTYYDYIHGESERLSRLINNVLQLARMTRNDLQVHLESVTVAELMDTIRSTVSSQVERSGFELRLGCCGEVESAVIEVDRDCFTQIIINLVDNAIKFSAKAALRRIDIGCRPQGPDTVVFSVRDYGPGVPGDKAKKIFQLFYRPESALTRETAGTGIGLALVQQLTCAMKGRVDVVDSAPGAACRLSFRRA